ncbi:hypothetical protein BH10PSE14_BH10PSE14_06740 [soil metagenome]
MSNDLETPMAALFAHIVGAVTVAFTANIVAGDVVLRNVSNFTGLFAGLPVFCDGIERGTAIAALSPGAATVTLSLPPATAGTAATVTTGFLTTGRRVPHWNQVSDQPAFFLRRTGVTVQNDDNFMPIITIECEAWIYCNAGQDPTVAPDQVLTPLERMIRDSFVPDASYGDERFTLGGLVHWCRFEGRADISPGDQGPQAIARLPIRITLP